MSVPSFEHFFVAVHGYEPFPWQKRLAQVVLTRGWPDLLDLPTGAGKTSALDVALYCLAVAPERLPRRTVLVVDRRVVVDQGAEHSRKLLAVMRDARQGPVRMVGDALRAIWGASGDEDPFAVAVMRGGMPRDNDWARRPDQPVLGVSTVDQVGSRLLFRGYGISPKSASIHAGLLGNDTLILLDEVHLAEPFEQTLSAICRRFRGNASGLPDRFGVVRMSATARATDSTWQVLGLMDEDREHPVLSRRLTASKRARLQIVKVAGDDEALKLRRIAEAAAAEAIRLQSAEDAPVVGVVVNRVDTARLTYQRLMETHTASTDVILVTGRMRAIDRDQVVKATLWPRVGPRHRGAAMDRPLVVVATQCIEAGADFDFDALVTECASLDALRQRFGRLDRQGDRRSSKATILGRSDAVAQESDDPIYGKAIAATWDWLKSVAEADEVDFGIAVLATPVHPDGTPRLDVQAHGVNAPVMLPAHLDAWAQTSPLPAYDPDIDLWLHGPDRPSADVQVVWRSDIVLPDGFLAEDALETAIQILSVRRPSSLESITVPLPAARRWLAGEAAPAIADTTIGPADPRDTQYGRFRTSKNRAVVALRWEGDESTFVSENEIKPGDVLVIPSIKGGITAGSFDPNSDAAVFDIADLAQLRARGIASLLLRSDALNVWNLPDGMGDVPTPNEDETSAEARERIVAWIARWPKARPTACPATDREWHALTTALTAKHSRATVLAGSFVVSARVSRTLSSAAENGEVISEDDDSSFRQAAVTLSAHCGHVRDWTARFAEAVGFRDELASDLSLAAWLHDVGKADPRFQQLLAGGSEVGVALLTEPLAKSAMPPGDFAERRSARKRSGYPSGYRHELLSIGMVEDSREALNKARDRDLVLHLIASHHGWCRPFAPMLDDLDDRPVELMHGGVRMAGRTRHGRSRLDSGVGHRYWALVDKYGWWGLAWLEAVLRLADHRASEMETRDAE